MNKKTYKLRNLLHWGLIVFGLFCLIFILLDKISLGVYLLAYCMIMVIICAAYLHEKNVTMLARVWFGAILSILAYVLARVVRSDISSWAISGRPLIVCFMAAAAAFITIYLLCVLCFYSYKNKRHNQDAANQEVQYFRSRRHDLERIEEYIQYIDAIGINGAWGTGKSFVMDCFCKKHREDYYFLKVDLLTCNWDEADIFLLQEMETLLKKNRIFPRYSRQLQNIMSEHSLLKEIRYIFQMDSDVKSKVFEEFRGDIGKLDKPIVIIIEDLERIQDEGLIKKLLDLTERMSCSRIKIVYEFDIYKLNELGLDRAYLEKYIPYVVNLTEITLQEMIDRFYKDSGLNDSELKQKEFHYLSYDAYQEDYISRLLGFSVKMSLTPVNVSARKVKTFLNEIKIALENPEIAVREDHKTVITFFFLKHFYPMIYEELDFREDFIFELKIQCPQSGAKHNVLELLALKRWNEAENGNPNGGLSSDDIKAMLVGDSDIAWMNRQKLCILYMMGYRIQYLDEAEKTKLLMNNEADARTAAKRRYAYLWEREADDIKHADHNDKISHLIRYLHASGKSELTNQEANAQKFIENVLNVSKTEQREANEKFAKEAFDGIYEKDNYSIFPLAGDWRVELAKALYILLGKKSWSDRKTDSWLKFIDYCHENGFASRPISYEYISWCNYINADERAIFLAIIGRFNDMQIAGNLNHEKVYLKFLQTYYRFACLLGYFWDFDDWKLAFDGTVTEWKSYITDFLNDCAESLKKDIDSKRLSNEAIKELKIVLQFFKKNLDIINQEKPVNKQTDHQRTRMESKWIYVNEEVYNRLEETGKSGISLEEYRKTLDQSYKNNEISLHEMRRLISDYHSK